MLNLGPYSTKEYPNLRIKPTVVDRLLEAMTIVIVVAAWVCLLYVYFNSANRAMYCHLLTSMALGLPTFLLFGIAYLPIRFVNFPIRITANNVATQYFLAIRLLRVINVLITLLFLFFVMNKVSKDLDIAKDIIYLLSAIVTTFIPISLIVYYIFAFRLK